MSQKTRINLYLDSSVGESFKRYCKSHRMSYCEVIETLIYRFLISPQSSKSHSESSSLNAMQNEIHNQAVNAYRRVYDSHRKEVIDSAVSSSGSQQVEDVSPQIPMPIPTSEVNHHERPRTQRLSKREKRG